MSGLATLGTPSLSRSSVSGPSPRPMHRRKPGQPRLIRMHTPKKLRSRAEPRPPTTHERILPALAQLRGAPGSRRDTAPEPGWPLSSWALDHPGDAVPGQSLGGHPPTPARRPGSPPIQRAKHAVAAYHPPRVSGYGLDPARLSDDWKRCRKPRCPTSHPSSRTRAARWRPTSSSTTSALRGYHDRRGRQLARVIRLDEARRSVLLDRVSQPRGPV